MNVTGLTPPLAVIAVEQGCSHVGLGSDDGESTIGVLLILNVRESDVVLPARS